MRCLFPIIVALTLCSCAAGEKRAAVSPPSLGLIRTSIIAADGSVDRISVVAADVRKTGAVPNDKRIIQIMNDLKAVKADLERAKQETDSRQKEIEHLTGEMNRVVDRLNYLEPKYAEAIGILWKWRIIAIGSWVLIACFFVFRSWIKIHFPFMARFL